ncbi:hypothetical protein CL86_gp077 [Mycobacterium phage SkiPole]|uniref:Uncharacterized protein n=1 Tax=Mycobacterium phage SkiPole TaxID=701456 RepID=D2XRS1_9CAUD|nr:hypothetical protein CL86_gp077 [Mycobacterium phage SkiPole]ADA83824.1 hypothetical protein SKIPOLE_77 [Mycobacterium phage SkiPole]
MVNEHDLVTRLARIAEGAALALKNRHNRLEMVAGPWSKGVDAIEKFSERNKDAQ